jgi:hypothetical protein
MSGWAASNKEVNDYLKKLMEKEMEKLRNDPEIKLRARFDVHKAERGVPCGAPYGTNWQKNQVYCEHYNQYMSNKQGGAYRKTKSKSRKARKSRKSRKPRK